MRMLPVIISLCWIGACCLLFGCERQDHPIGRDTVKSFGNGRFQILRSYQKREHLSDLEPTVGKEIVSHIKSWRSKGDWVYVLSKKDEYTVLNYRAGTSNTYANLDDAPGEHRDELTKL